MPNKITDLPVIEWQKWTNHPEPKASDLRMVRCVLEAYDGPCPAKSPIACICKDFPAVIYLRLMKQKYGDDDNG